MPFCAKCGNDLGETDQFCSNCGSAIESAAPPDRQKSSDDRKAKMAFYVLMGALVVMWLAMGMPTDRFWWR